MRYFVFPLTLWIASSCLAAWGQSNFKPGKDLFSRTCQQNRDGSSQFVVAAPQVGAEAFFPTLALEATQTRYSFRRLIKSIKKARQEEKNWFGYDGGRSVYGISKRLKTVFYRGKLFIVDGHHRALLSVYFGAETTPMLVLADLSELSEQEFRNTMEERGWAHWKDHQGNPVPPVDLCQMTDDPNFQLARLLMRRVDVELNNGQVKIAKSTGATVPLVIKLNGDIPFFEIHIADALRRHGVHFDDKREEQDLEQDELFNFHRFISQEAQAHSSPLSKVLLLEKPTPVAELNLEEIIVQHLQSNSCENALRSSSHEI